MLNWRSVASVGRAVAVRWLYTSRAMPEGEVHRLRGVLAQCLAQGKANEAYKLFGVLRGESAAAVGVEAYSDLLGFATHNGKAEVALAVLKDMATTGVAVTDSQLEGVAAVGLAADRHDIVAQVAGVCAGLGEPPSGRLLCTFVASCVAAGDVAAAVSIVEGEFGALPEEVLVEGRSVPLPPALPAAVPEVPFPRVSRASTPSRALGNAAVTALCGGDRSLTPLALRVMEAMRCGEVGVTPSTFEPLLASLRASPVPGVPCAGVYATMRESVNPQGLASEVGLGCGRLTVAASLAAGDVAAAVATLRAMQADTHATHADVCKHVLRALVGGGDVTGALVVLRGALRLVSPSSKDKPGRLECEAVVGAGLAAGHFHACVALLADMKHAGVALSRRMLGDVVLRMLGKGSPAGGDLSLAMGFVMGLSLGRGERVALPHTAYNALLGALAQAGRLTDVETVLHTMAVAGVAPDAMRLTLLCVTFSAAGNEAGAEACRSMLGSLGDGAHVKGTAPEDLLAAVEASLDASPTPQFDAVCTVATALLRGDPPQPAAALRIMRRHRRNTDDVDTGLCVTLLKVCTSGVQHAAPHARHDAMETLRRAVEFVVEVGVVPATSAGRTVVLKAMGYCGMTAELLPAFDAAVSDGVADTKLANTALSQLLRHGDAAGAHAVVAAMKAHQMAPTDVTRSLLGRLEQA